MSRRADLCWLTAQPIAHRGLHEASAGVIENTRTAVRRAIECGYAIEIDVQRSADDAVVVFHDDDLDRLTEATGPVDGLTSAELRGIPLRGTTDRIWSLAELLEEVGGRVPLVVELKSRFDGDMRLAAAAGGVLAAYSGRAVAKSFDPALVASLRNSQPDLPRGVIGCAFEDDEWSILSPGRRLRYRNLLHWPETRPDFLSWDVHDLPRAAVTIARQLFGTPVLSWTVRTPADQARAAMYADQMIFEGFLP